MTTTDQKLAAAGIERRTRTRLNTEDLIRLIRSDPRDPGTKGRIRAIKDFRKLTSAERQLVELLESVPRRQRPSPATDPMAPALRPLPKGSTGKGLSEVELAILATIPHDPSKIGPDDARELVRLEASADTQAEKRLVARYLGPLRAKVETETARATAAHDANPANHSTGIFGVLPAAGQQGHSVRELVVQVLSQARTDEVAAQAEAAGLDMALVEGEARGFAAQVLAEQKASLLNEAATKMTAARATLASLDAPESGAA